VRSTCLLLAACAGEEPEPAGFQASAFALDPGLALQHATADDPATGPTRWLLAEGTTWEIREGASWESAAVVETLEVALGGDLTVDGEVVLPASVAEGSAAGDAQVSAVGPFEAWYGTYDPAASVEVAAGRAAGSWAFAQDFGPVFFTLDGTAWDLVYYEERAP
jgi:hypothetical protein